MATRKRPGYEEMITVEVTVQKNRIRQSDVSSIIATRPVEAPTDKETSDQTKQKAIDEALQPEQSSLISNSYRE